MAAPPTRSKNLPDTAGEIPIRPVAAQRTSPDEARRQLRYELIGGVSGLILALFMWGHMVLVGSILTGERGFDWLAGGMEYIYLAQPTVFAISFLFLLHAAMASRKIPAQLRERRRMRELAQGLGDQASPGTPSAEAPGPTPSVSLQF